MAIACVADHLDLAWLQLASLTMTTTSTRLQSDSETIRRASGHLADLSGSVQEVIQHALGASLLTSVLISPLLPTSVLGPIPSMLMLLMMPTGKSLVDTPQLLACMDALNAQHSASTPPSRPGTQPTNKPGDMGPTSVPHCLWPHVTNYMWDANMGLKNRPHRGTYGTWRHGSHTWIPRLWVP